MNRLCLALAGLLFLAPAASACTVSLPFKENMFAGVTAPVDNLISLPGDAGAFEYLDETQLDTIHLNHAGKTYQWTAENTARTCSQRSGARRCRVIADSPQRFGRLTLTREEVDGAWQLRYRLLLVEGRRHLRLFPHPARTEGGAACNLMKALDTFRTEYMGA